MKSVYLITVLRYLVINQSGTFPASHISRIATMSSSLLSLAETEMTSELDARHLHQLLIGRGLNATSCRAVAVHEALWPSLAEYPGTGRGAACTIPVYAQTVPASDDSRQSASAGIMLQVIVIRLQAFRRQLPSRSELTLNCDR